MVYDGFQDVSKHWKGIKVPKVFPRKSPKEKKGRLVTVNFAEAIYVSKHIIEKNMKVKYMHFFLMPTIKLIENYIAAATTLI